MPKFNIYAGANHEKFNIYSNIKMAVHIENSQSVPVLTGGQFALQNGDTLYINAKNGTLTIYEEEVYTGIGLSLESGNDFCSYLIIPTMKDSYQSGYNAFYDIERLYAEGNIIKVYDWSNSGGIYETGSEDNDYDEPSVAGRSTLIAIIVLEKGNWILKNIDIYKGDTITLQNEKLFISSLSAIELESAIYFTRSSGKECIAYYKRNSQVLAQSSNFWFGNLVPQNNDVITIYDLNNNGYEVMNYDFSESNAQNTFTLLATLIYNNGHWVLN